VVVSLSTDTLAVTAVGSTIGLPEVAVNFTGGGFNYFAQPSSQSKIVPGYLKTLPSSFAGKFNHSGRGYPDVVVQGWNFEVIIGGEFGLVGGTSASSPTFAGIIALVNDRLGQAGKKPLGFLNPFLYQSAGPAGAFNDITKGKNVGFTCNDTAVAFSPGAGWDPVTGFGTPNFPKLLKAAGVRTPLLQM
jgi:tripeptidyl-peptidase-1